MFVSVLKWLSLFCSGCADGLVSVWSVPQMTSQDLLSKPKGIAADNGGVSFTAHLACLLLGYVLILLERSFFFNIEQLVEMSEWKELSVQIGWPTTVRRVRKFAQAVSWGI